MEGSNEESEPSGQSHHHTQHGGSHIQHSLSQTQHSAFQSLGEKSAPPIYPLTVEPVAEQDDLNQSTHIVDTSAYQPPDDSPGLADQSVYIDTENPFDMDTVRRILAQLPTPVKLHPSYHEVPRQIQSIICGITITLGLKLNQSCYSRSHESGINSECIVSVSK